MRLFVAIGVGAAIIDEAQRAIRDLRNRVEQHGGGARVTWIPPALMHLTVRFVGEVPEAEVDRVAAALSPPLALFPFQLSVRGIGAFSNHGVPRVVWAGIERGVAETRAVERTVTDRLAAVDIPPDDRPFSPHLTLGRVRQPGTLRTRTLLEGLADRPLGETRVDTITLFHSRLSPNGPTYVPLLVTPVGS